MKKTLMALSAGTFILLAGCGSVENTEQENQEVSQQTSDEIRFTPEIWTDKTTGCDYLVVSTGSKQGGVAITPRLDSSDLTYCEGSN